MPTRRSNDFPTAVMLATDKALCPNARVASTNRNRTTTPPVMRLMVQTTAPSPRVKTNVATRRPARSNSRPIGRQTIAPISVAQRLMLA